MVILIPLVILIIKPRDNKLLDNPIEVGKAIENSKFHKKSKTVAVKNNKKRNLITI